MGKKGSKLSADAESAAANLVEALASLRCLEQENVRWSRDLRERNDVRHGKMPYYSVPDFVLGSPADLLLWGKGAVEASRAPKKA